jgi:hypothetical protein
MGSVASSLVASPATSSAPKPVTPRGRGRPRKDWATIPPTTSTSNTLSNTASQQLWSPSEPTSNQDPSQPALNLADAELLLHFTSETAATFSSPQPDDPILRFWSYNAPRLGLTHPFILHLIHAIAGYHLAHDASTPDRHQHYARQADRHVARGLALFTTALAAISAANGGALYVGALLVCYCAFAAKPAGPADLLLCPGGRDDALVAWLPLIRGVRAIRARVDDAVLFAGWTAPLNAPDGRPADARPRCEREGFERVAWVAPVRALRAFLAARVGGEVEVCVRALELMVVIFEANYGGEDGSYDGPGENALVFGWLYRVDDEFVELLRQKQPLALVIVAYYAVLLKTMDNLWFVEGWGDHVLYNISCHVSEEFTPWLQWPMEQANRSKAEKSEESVETHESEANETDEV